MPVFSEMSDGEFQNSALITRQLTEKIQQQIHDYNIDRDLEKEIESRIKKERAEKHEKILEEA